MAAEVPEGKEHRIFVMIPNKPCRGAASSQFSRHRVLSKNLVELLMGKGC